MKASDEDEAVFTWRIAESITELFQNKVLISFLFSTFWKAE